MVGPVDQRATSVKRAHSRPRQESCGSLRRDQGHGFCLVSLTGRTILLRVRASIEGAAMTTLRSALLMLRDDVLGAVWLSALSASSKRAMRNSLWLAGMIATASCAPSTATVRTEGSRLLSCADVNVVWLRDLDYDAKGCGHEVSMRCDKASCRGLSAPQTVPKAPLSANAWSMCPCTRPRTSRRRAARRWASPKARIPAGASPNTKSRSTGYAEPRTSGAPTMSRSTSSAIHRAEVILVGGRLFKCPEEAVTQAAPAVSSCVPDCSPGFVCANASCVSACNPPCAATQQCGADRICHAAR